VVGHGGRVRAAVRALESGAGRHVHHVVTDADIDVLEIAPGHGRWTEHLLAAAGSVVIVDINQECLDACRSRFGDDPRLRGHLTPRARG
jgi:16S rRNA A1518/A1519 N6-dimethyltransferase RsmA/KsgA/DIM1 with predicted DNA glycosylase/AP lyase activity